MQTLTEIRQLLAQRGLRPKRRLGQNFLHDKNQLHKLIDAAGIAPADLVLEVGPGTGTLTEALLERGAEVVACEIDPEMAAIIEEVFAAHLREPGSVSPDDGRDGSDTPQPLRSDTPELADRAPLTLIRGDALEGDRRLNREIVQALRGRGGGFKLVANLPYQVASALMSALLIEHSGGPALRAGSASDARTTHGSESRATGCTGQFVTIQKEVADRLLAGPSTKQYGPLSIIVQAFASVERIGTVSPSCFWPPPEVTSAMVAVLPLPLREREGLCTVEGRRAFARFVTELFTKRRKQLGTIFGRDAALPIGIDPTARPEALTVEQIIELWQRMGRAASRG